MYYSAKEAMELLKEPSTSFYRKVKDGKIPHKGKRPNMQFPKEAIDALVEIGTEDEGSNGLSFGLSTIADAWTKQEITRQPYADADAVPFKTVLAWRRRNDEISMHVKEGSKMRGWTTFLPLDEKVAMALLEDRIREKDIPLESIKRWHDKGLSVYVPIIEVVPTGNIERDKEIGAFLIRNTLRWAIRLMFQCEIKNWYAIGSSQEGQTILESLGFDLITNLENGERKGYILQSNSVPVKALRSFLRSMERNNLLPETNKSGKIAFQITMLPINEAT
jgi:hypothetical protein